MDLRYVSKAKMEVLRFLESKGAVKIHTADSVYEAMMAGPKQFRKEASAVRDAMNRNSEVLVEGLIPEGVLNCANRGAPTRSVTMSLVAAGNTYNPCLLLLREKSYILQVEEGDDRLIWTATKGEHSFTGYTPPELLGIVVLWERFGNDWNRQQPNILGELTDQAVS